MFNNCIDNFFARLFFSMKQWWHVIKPLDGITHVGWACKYLLFNKQRYWVNIRPIQYLFSFVLHFPLFCLSNVIIADMISIDKISLRFNVCLFTLLLNVACHCKSCIITYSYLILVMNYEMNHVYDKNKHTIIICIYVILKKNIVYPKWNIFTTKVLSKLLYARFV